MNDRIRERHEKSLRFLDKLRGSPSENTCARATVRDKAGNLIACGLVILDPSLDHPESGYFEPDDVELLDAIKTDAKYILVVHPELIPIVPSDEIHVGHIHFSCGTDRKKLPLSQE